MDRKDGRHKTDFHIKDNGSRGFSSRVSDRKYE